jgi:signal peptidase I
MTFAIRRPGALALLGAAALAVGAAVALGRARRKWTVVTVDGPSMEPALRSSDRVLVRRRTAGCSPCAGQVVVFQSPVEGMTWETAPLPVRGVGSAHWCIKRVAAAPGDPVPLEIAAGAGLPVGAPVPAGKLLVLGDNRAASFDSRRWGNVPLDRVLGVVVRRLNVAG